jgi:hypothetical protein
MDADVSGKPRIAGAVHDPAVANQQIETLSWLRANAREEAHAKNPHPSAQFHAPFWDQVLIFSKTLCRCRTSGHAR